MARQTATASLMRSINRSTVLDLIRQESPIARAEIARRLGMGLPTVVRIVDELLAEDLVRPLGTSEPTGGRPRPLLAFNGEAHAVVGVDLGGDTMYGAVADLAGHVGYEAEQARNGGDAQANVEQLCNLIDLILRAPRPEGQRVRGIGIGAPGITNSPEGVVAWAPSLRWRDLPLQEILMQRFGLPVFVENDVRLEALGEWGFGAGTGLRNLVYITLGTGIGAGIILDSALYRGGPNQSAGEIGYLPPGIGYLGQRYERFGALESRASSTGIVERAEKLLAETTEQTLVTKLRSEDVFNAARRGESWACQTIAETVDYLSLAIASVSTLLDPDLIVLGGDAGAGQDLLVEPILQRLSGVLLFAPRLIASSLGRRAAVMGATMRVLNGTTAHVTVTEIP
jgi:predicted NBD/HSP70 family sugar kinase